MSYILEDPPSYVNASSVESRLMPPPLPPHNNKRKENNQISPNTNNLISGSDQPPSTRSANNFSSENVRANRFSRNASAAAGINVGLSLYNNNQNNGSTDQLQQGYGDTQTLRADDSRLQLRDGAIAMSKQQQQFDSNGGVREHQPAQGILQNQQSAEPMAMSVSVHNAEMYLQNN